MEISHHAVSGCDEGTVSDPERAMQNVHGVEIFHVHGVENLDAVTLNDPCGVMVTAALVILTCAA